MVASQLIWNKRAAEILAKNGHYVTLIRMKPLKYRDVDVSIDPSIRQWIWDIQPKNLDYDHFMNVEMPKTMFKDSPPWDNKMREVASKGMTMFVDSCEELLKNRPLLEQLKSVKFDLAFAHMFDYCPIGLIHYAKIPTWIWFNSATIFDIVAMVINDENRLFRKYIDPNFPDLRELGRQCPLVMTNTNEIYDIPRPTLHKVVNVGGLGMKMSSAKNLTGDFAKIVDSAKNVVLFSFGSAVNSSNMPWEWKVSFMKAFERFPDHVFIARYAIHDLDEIKPKNVHLFKWLPQNDLIQHPKTKALLAHGGYNSLQEAIHAAKPIITIPFVGDQPRNGRVAEKYRFGYYLTKGDINEENVYKALDAVLNDPSYMTHIKRFNQMALKRPISPEVSFAKWTEFLAEFKDLPNLTPYGIHLNFIQYHNLDVFAFIGSIIGLILYLLYRFSKLLIRIVKSFIGLFVGRKVKTQ